jgi:hypothetical protein
MKQFVQMQKRRELLVLLLVILLLLKQFTRLEKAKRKQLVFLQIWKAA